MDKTTRNYRVRILIYDDVESTIDNPDVYTDEPLHAGAPNAEIVRQAHRTYRSFENKLAGEQ